jgi:OOP family OmpA-OmpF porin
LGIAQAQDLKPTMTEACLTVSVSDSKKKAQTGEQVTFENITTKKQYSGVTKEDGKFKILVPKGVTYKIKYKNFSTNVDYSTLPLPLAKDTLVSFDVNIIFELPKVYTLNNVFFDSGKASLRPESSKELNELAEYMTLKKTLVIEIAGHTDNVGAKEANQKLSEDRANSVRDYLMKKAIAPERVTAKGYGDTQPVANNDTDKGKQQNRRTEVRIIKN